MNNKDMPLPSEKPLQPWKEIAAFLERDERTARRWEKEEALPVRRHRIDARGTVYAYPSELEAWRLARKPRPAEAELPTPAPQWPKWIVPSAAGLALLGSLLVVRYGPILNPPRPLVEAADGAVAVKLVWSGPGVDGTAAPTPDGRFAAATDWNTRALVLRELSTGKTRQLVGGDTALNANHTRSFSHDGKWLAYDWSRPGSGSLRLLNMADGSSRTIFDKPGTRGLDVWGWSPDDSAVLVNLNLDKQGADQSMIAVISTDSGQEKRILATGELGVVTASLSPDGEWVAYDHKQEGKAGYRDIRVIAVDGSHDHAVVQHPAHDVLMGWGRGGLLFTSDRRGSTDLFQLPMHDGQPVGEATAVKRNIGDVFPIHFDASGTYYFSSRANTSDGHIAAFDPQSGKLTGEPRAASPEFSGAQSSLDWSPEGKRIALILRKQWPSNVVGAMRLRIRDLTTNSETEIPLNLTWAEFPRWSPGGDEILLAGRDENHRPNVTIVNLRGGQPRRVTPAEAESEYQKGVWSRDGKALILVKKGRYRESLSLVRREVASGREVEIHKLPNPRALLNLDVSPDGESIVFHAVAEKETSLMIVPVLGGAPREIARLAGWIPLQCLQWSPAGRMIYFTIGAAAGDDDGVRTLWRIAATGGHPVKTGISREGLRRVRVSPDGKQLAFVTGKLTTEFWAMEWSGVGGPGK